MKTETELRVKQAEKNYFCLFLATNENNLEINVIQSKYVIDIFFCAFYSSSSHDTEANTKCLVFFFLF